MDKIWKLKEANGDLSVALSELDDSEQDRRELKKRVEELEVTLRAVFLDESDLSDEGYEKIEKALKGCIPPGRTP